MANCKISQKTFQKGDKVQWSSGRGTTTGTVQEKITANKKVDGKTISASESNPRYLVKNDSSGKVTSHDLDALSDVDSTADTQIHDSQTKSQRSSKSSKSSEGSRSSEKQPEKKDRSKNGAESVELGDPVEWQSRY
jgi:hypothetical protein